MHQKISYKQWYIPYARDDLTLRQAHHSMSFVRAEQVEIPLMVQLVENPKYQMPGFRVFHGAVDLLQHDYIHITLGRGLLEKDEAFTIGFTMGSTKKVTTTEEKLYALIARYLYPKVYQFAGQDMEIFRNAVHLGYISGCAPLDEFDFTPYLDASLRDLRAALGLESELLLAYYGIEKSRYPDSPESQRLVEDAASIAMRNTQN
ncbi:MAG: hypothetical protein GXP08_18660 [Gammaproteobacteria bacterium]|nr:hypothetical protein [Gammaproteobacteria bacterium]